MSALEPPTRQTVPARCRCVLHGADRCHREAGPDAPFCSDCEDRHPEVPRVHVGFAPLDVGGRWPS